jgi:hypothetical protein
MFVPMLAFVLAPMLAPEYSPQEPPVVPPIPEDPEAPQALGPIMEFKGAYPFDTQSVLEVTPDNTRAFLAEGAAITILDLTSLSGTPLEPAVIDRVPLENASPRALRYFEHPLSHEKFLFVAGGTMGLWRVSLCPAVMAVPPATPTECTCTGSGCDPYDRIQIDLVEDQASFQRKRCIDVTIVEGNQSSGNVPILCALFSARASTPMPFGPTEMRTYLLNQNGTIAPYQAPVYLGTALGLAPKAVGNSIVSDPGNPNAVYVSMGIAWLYKVDLSTTTLSASQHGMVPSGCPLSPCTSGEQMRDLAIVKTTLHGSVLYAALDYGRILEYQLGASTTTTAFTVSQPDPTGKYPSRIQAIPQGEKVLIALGLHRDPGTLADTSHIQTTGGWTGYGQSPGLPDPNNAPIGAGDSATIKEIRFYTRDLSLAPTLVPIGTRPFGGASWGSLVLRELSQTKFRSYVSPLLMAYDVEDPFGGSPVIISASVFTYEGDGLSTTDGTISVLNPQFTYFGVDGSSQAMFATENGDFQPVMHAALCDDFPGPGVPACIGDKIPNPFLYGSVQAVANWPDSDGQNEWFVSGGPMWRRVTTAENCTEVVNDLCTPTDPCGSAGPYWWRKHEEQIDDDMVPNVGWLLVKMVTGNIMGNPPSAATSGMHWWQLYSPATTGEKAEGHDYLNSQADPRTVLVGGVSQPRFIHCIRTGSNRGLKIFQTADIIASTAPTCGGTSPGHGEVVQTPPVLECETHVEIETLEGCKIRVPMPNGEFSTRPRSLFNNKSDVFQVTAPDGTHRWIIAVTQGWVASAPGLSQPDTCHWDDYFGRAMVAFYDITAPVPAPWPPAPTPGPLPPIRVGLSTNQGHAWAVKAKTYPSGDTYAIVADFAGKLLVFKVNFADLFDPTKSPYHASDALLPQAIYRFPGDPSDSLAANCIDLELDGDLLYCALGRAGLGIVDVSLPEDPVLVYLIDTPGLVEGLARRTINGKDQLVVGDTRCGMRLYGRPGE